MRAVLTTAHGGPEVLELRTDYPCPNPSTGQVLVRVAATAVNFHDIFTRRGMPGVKINLPVVVGSDIAGTVEALGPGVADHWLGRRVLVRRTYPGRRVERVPVQSYVAGTPGDPAARPGLPSRPTLLDQEDDLIEEARPGYDVVQETESTGYRSPDGQARPAGPRPGAKSTVTEVVEDLYEEP